LRKASSIRRVALRKRQGKSPAHLAGLFAFSIGLLGDAQLGQIGADGVERGDDLARRGEQEELVRSTGAVLK
jgi:hypothetical protein